MGEVGFCHEYGSTQEGGKGGKNGLSFCFVRFAFLFLIPNMVFLVFPFEYLARLMSVGR